MYRGKRKGITLIEVVMYLGLIAIITSTTVSTVGVLNKIKLSVGVNSDIGKIHDLLVIGKVVSKTEGIPGKVIYDKNNNYMEYYNKNESMGIDLKNVVIERINSSDGMIYITDKGMITTSCTITIRGDDSKKYEITINVGSYTIDVKK